MNVLADEGESDVDNVPGVLEHAVEHGFAEECVGAATHDAEEDWDA
jgi:hypothetical protein